ncbi:MAG: HU family DNA-binding protein [Tannerellaceae bacterium]|nr:HU family DNA-binding protein [Tannerellaceae bacterium]
MAGEEAGKTKTYGMAKATGTCDMIKLCKLVSARSAISSAEVKSVVDNLVWAMELKLQSGNIVQLPGFGNFRITIRTRGTEDENDFTASNIRRSRLVFTPSPELRNIASNVTFKASEVIVKEVSGEPEECPLPHIE